MAEQTCATDEGEPVEALELTEGSQYRITELGATLVESNRHPYSRRSESRYIEPGEIVTYLGKRSGLAHGEGGEHWFETSEGDRGGLYPSSWGHEGQLFLVPFGEQDSQVTGAESEKEDGR